MQSTPNVAKCIEVLRAERHSDGSHSSERFVARLRRGELLRVRRGIYVAAKEWAAAPPWRRYEVVVAAVAMSRPLVFCRETALVLHGLPLLRTPNVVWARTTDPGAVKLHVPSAMTGSLTSEQFRRRYASVVGDAAALSDTALSNIPTKLLEPACPQGVTRVQLRTQLRTGETQLPEVVLEPGTFDHVAGPEVGYQSELLALSVLDSASRMPFVEAVVLLDAVKARGEVDVEGWSHYLRSRRQRLRCQQAWSFADGRAESALESESRVVLAQLKCPAPALQRLVRTRRGDYRVDFCWEREGVLGEVDGKAKYFHQEYTRGVDAAEVHYREKLRREALEGQGWRVVRWGKAELRNPGELSARLQTAGVL